MSEEKKLWGGRFTGETDERFFRFNRSFGFDRRLFKADIEGSRAHCRALERAGVLSTEEAEKICGGLELLLERASAGEGFLADERAEDVHSFIEARLTEEIGDAARKLHTGRSRNDQVATALRIWMKEAVGETERALRTLQTGLVALAEDNFSAVMPGYTHLQKAQPILFAHWCLAYFEMFRRDAARLSDLRRRVDVLPLGSAALAGTSYEIDRRALAADLGFEGVSANSLDAVSDRDFCVEYVLAAALIMTHLSRLAEDLILYCTEEFGFFELSDAVATGSSLMPQKKNPDAMELVRGKTGRVHGALLNLLTVLKGLPLAYNKDMQEDKEAVFDAFDTVLDCLEVTSVVLGNLSLRPDKMRAAAARGHLNATELADYLSGKGIPFRTAHEIAGRMVLRAIETKRELGEMDLEEMREFSDRIGEDVYAALTLEAALAKKSSTGGTAPERVREALDEAKSYLDS